MSYTESDLWRRVALFYFGMLGEVHNDYNAACVNAGAMDPAEAERVAAAVTSMDGLIASANVNTLAASIAMSDPKRWCATQDKINLEQELAREPWQP